MTTTRDAQACRAAFFGVLGVESQMQLVAGVLTRVREALRDVTATDGPVCLASVARRFLVSPTPVVTDFADLHCGGSLEYQPAVGEFRILLSERIAGTVRHYTQRTLWHDALAQCHPIDDLSLGPRARFVYAHEFAHRFFYVLDNERWTRAVDVVSRLIHGEKALFALHRLEEKLCNVIAAELLLPSQVLQDYLRTSGIRGDATSASFERLGTVMLRIANQFGASVESVLVSILKAHPCRELLPTGLCVFHVQRASRLGGKKEAPALRSTVGLLPKAVDGKLLRPHLPGLRLAHLGPRLVEHVSSLLKMGRRDRVTIKCEIMLETQDGTAISKDRFGFDGWGMHLRGTEATGAGILWGELTHCSTSTHSSRRDASLGGALDHGDLGHNHDAVDETG